MSDEGEKIVKSDAEWRAELNDEEYHVARAGGTERAFTGKFWETKSAGTYTCRCCGANLFSSQDKFDSGSGWPSYTAPHSTDAVQEREDHGQGMVRTEVVCSNCDAHLGHLFPDGPGPTGQRYCINSVCLNLESEEDSEK